jgi:hypothetical protein
MWSGLAELQPAGDQRRFATFFAALGFDAFFATVFTGFFPVDFFPAAFLAGDLAATAFRPPVRGGFAPPNTASQPVAY